MTTNQEIVSTAPPVNLTINGQPVQGRPGQTVLEAAAAAGIHIPTLCHHPALPPEGSCRVCLIEIERQRGLQPACAFPVAQGMNVRSDTEKVIAARRFALQMIFSERPHYCMFCQVSGGPAETDCELQRLAYEHGIDCWDYPPDAAKPWPVDASRRYFVMDHSRCILCRRCVRACAAIAANHTLGVLHRGTRSMICADDDAPLGESSCVSCGTCLQVCPTGALIDRTAAYRGHAVTGRRTRASCLGCAVGCGIEAVTRGNQLLRIDGDWTAPNGGLLCVTGRFEALDSGRHRVTTPMLRRNGALEPVGWDEALTAVAGRLRTAAGVGGLASPRMTTEALVAFTCFFNEVLNSDEVGLLRGEVPPLDLGATATLADVARADCIVIVGGDPLENQKVLGYLAKRALDRGARLVVVSDAATGLDDRAHLRLRLDSVAHAGATPFELLRYSYHLRLDGISQLRSQIQTAARPVVMYGGGLSTAVHAALRALPDKTRFLPLIEGANAAGAARLGLAPRPLRQEVLYVLIGDDLPNGHALPAADFTIAQAAYHTSWTEKADALFPARTWAEKEGSFLNIEGRECTLVPILEPPHHIEPDWVTLTRLAAAMDRPFMLGAISDNADSPLARPKEATRPS